MPPGGSNPRSGVDDVLGYLNLSSGRADPRFRRAINGLFAEFEASGPGGTLPWHALGEQLAERLGGSSEAEGASQAESVIPLVFSAVPAAYRAFHADLLHHQSEASLLRPFFLCRVAEAVLSQGSPWDETERIVTGAVRSLNDYVGYRPVAVLNTRQRVEPYAHEWVSPIPLYWRGVGVATGKYQRLIAQAWTVLESTDAEILAEAAFDPARLDEIAVDPRAYDFDHPVHKRPNHQFGQWDPHRLDRSGYFCRFVLHEVTLDAIWSWTVESTGVSQEERLMEAGTVLAGVILMSAAIDGRGPDTHDSATTLATLTRQIAKFRDAFYDRWLARIPGEHGQRLKAEATALRQPFGAVRQQLNQQLARLRATQLQHVHLAQMFARMGYPEASRRQAEIVPVASARMLCEINSDITSSHHAIDRGQLAQAGEILPRIESTLHRAIECGALVDPWNMLGFQAQFSLFPAVENTVHDHRVDVLIHLQRRVCGLLARLEGEAAAAGETALELRVAGRLARLATWWDRFASGEVSSIDGFSGREAEESARRVAAALGAWHAAGAASGDMVFWREHVANFSSPKAYALVVEALLDKRDFIAARALLVQWLAGAEQAPLAADGHSFHDLAVRWIKEIQSHFGGDARSDAEHWSLARKFFDYLEANAEDYWEVPHFEWEPTPRRRDRDTRYGTDDNDADELRDDEESDDPFAAAYEEMTYRDSARDGVEGEMLEGGSKPTDTELDWEATRIGKRLAFLVTLARMWKIAAASTLRATDLADRDEVMLCWYAQANANRRGLLALLEAVERHPLPDPKGNHESLVEYDRRRMVKEGLLGRVMAACVETADAARVILATLNGRAEREIAALPVWERHATLAVRALFRGDAARLQAEFPALRQALDEQPVLYVPLAKKGDARKIVAAQTVQQLLITLLRGLPRLGLVGEACQLVVTAQAMERHRPPGEGCVTEFDRLFQMAYLAIVESLVAASDTAPGTATDGELFEGLQTLTESLLKRWLEHSKSLRLSVVEKVADENRWKKLVAFIETYGSDLFTARFLNLGNLRSILHQSVDSWLKALEDDEEAADWRLTAELGRTLPREAAIEHLALVFEAICENYGEYKDYKTTTTQSDRGELLYTLVDFLRLKASYERFAWHIRPVVMCHEVLARRGKLATAELWRRAVAERTSEIADWHLQRLQDLTKRYGMRLPTIADRLRERFVRTLAIDRLRAWIGPAVDEARRGVAGEAFAILEQEVGEFTEQPTGSGLDVPAWLHALEQEVDRVAGGAAQDDEAPSDDEPPVPWMPLTWENVQAQLRAWDDA